MPRTLTKTLLMISTLTTLVACGSAGDSDTASCVLCGNYNDVRGSISSQGGSQAEMAGWIVASFEHDTSIARVAEVDSAGLYTLTHVKTDQAQTFALFTPDYLLQSVLSMDGPKPTNIRQYVKIGSAVMPKMINKGPIITFQNFQGLTATNDLASAAKGDGIPDGSASVGGASLTGLPAGFGELPAAPHQGMNLASASSNVDIDQDGVPNARDPDIDGDGIINVLDPDDNNNSIDDVFDGDANGDLVQDNSAAANTTDLYFKEGVEWIAVQFTLRPKDDGSGNESSLTFTTKVRDDVQPLSVQVRGAPTLLKDASYTANDSSGNPQKVAFSGVLDDDGLSEDGGAGDRIYAKKVTLPTAISPRAHESIFFELAFGTKESPWYMEFPYSFPPVKPAAITSVYDANTKTVQLKGNPYGAIQDFVWTIHLYDDADQVKWTSAGIPGTTRTFVIPEEFLLTGVKYKYSVSAQSLDKIPSYPTYTVFSKKYDIK